MDTDEGLQKAVIKEFGAEILDSQGIIDRKKLGDIIFSNSQKRARLNQLTHPRTFRAMFLKLLRLKFIENKELVVLDAPLFYETRILEYFCYPCIVVYTEVSMV